MGHKGLWRTLARVVANEPLLAAQDYPGNHQGGPPGFFNKAAKPARREELGDELLSAASPPPRKARDAIVPFAPMRGHIYLQASAEDAPQTPKIGRS